MMGTIPYPHPNPVPGSNAVGSFQIGISPIGDISPFDFYTTILSQYGNSTILVQLIQNLAQYFDQTQNLDAFYDSCWDILTCVGSALDRWGRVVSIGRVLQLPSSTSYLGFQEAGSWQPFGQAPFYSGAAVTNNYTLSDDTYRLLILAKTLFNACGGSIPAINQILLTLFPGLGNCYCTDGLNLTMTYTFEFILTPVQFAIVVNSGALPRPSGVSVTVLQGVPR